MSLSGEEGGVGRDNNAECVAGGAGERNRVERVPDTDPCTSSGGDRELSLTARTLPANKIRQKTVTDVRGRVRRGDSSSEEEEFCLSGPSPFFVAIYTFLGFIIVCLIGLNFLFNFNLLVFICLLAVIALFVLLLIEFDELPHTTE